ncbi:hypothetical protein ABB27_14360 [Stenotrophomonas terrae]|uniref:DUF2894 domain-containing protein n=1 Tax=Stenotrophomonas terrae TaxID=405446 RepID=A0A0R0CJU7_9GAMM|nr:DUF2894 domain-containing protein [Stenotrophomonas terrae]KRG65873.1 hypothetical protein ABB27_14360 [Stenotrophomonas terrae]
MTSADPAALAQLQAWRESNADRVDPARFELIASLAQRAQGYTGSARAQLDARLSQLIEAYAQLAAVQTPKRVAADAAESPLQSLLLQLTADPLQYQLPLATSNAAVGDTDSADSNETALMPALDEFQQLWSRIRIDSLLRQCLDSLPEDAGPLHSSVLTYRAMALMQDISPEYLQHFIAYVDVLTWMEQLGASSPQSTGGRAASTRKPARAGTGKRKKA